MLARAPLKNHILRVLAGPHSAHRAAYNVVDEQDDEESNVPTMAEVALRQAEVREAALARKVAAMEAELNRGKMLLSAQQRVKEVLTARVDTSRGGAREPAAVSTSSEPALSAREVKVCLLKGCRS